LHYFDYNATAPLSPKAREAWLAAQDAFWANPSSPTRLAARARNELESCRVRIAEQFGVRPERIVFTSGATEGNNAVFTALASGSVRSRAAISAIEHPSVREPAARWYGDAVMSIPVNAAGVCDLADIERMLSRERPEIVSILAASNETGVFQPWHEAAELCHRAGVAYHCDAVQWVGKQPLGGLEKAALVTASAHKFGGPKGVGFLLIGEAQSGLKAQVGGGQEHGLRSGTENLAGIAAMVVALEERVSLPIPSNAGRDHFATAMQALGARILGEAAPRLPNTVAMIMPRFDRMRWIARLERLGFVIGSGSACATGKEGPSATLAAMGISADEAKRSLRVSGGPDTPLDVWIALADAFAAVKNDLESDEGDERLVNVIDI